MVITPAVLSSYTMLNGEFLLAPAEKMLKRCMKQGLAEQGNMVPLLMLYA